MTNYIKRLLMRGIDWSRERRARLFNQLMQPTANDRILDLGGKEGKYFGAICPLRERVLVADIDAEKLAKASRDYGFSTRLLDHSGPLPFPDKHFDITFCSSVIQYVTITPDAEHAYYSTKRFRVESLRRQRQFAEEIRRVSRRYFVQTPYKYFVVESNTWLPFFVVWLPRKTQISLIKRFHHIWHRNPYHDWNLLTMADMRSFFPDATIYRERACLHTKSLIAFKG